jgi:two-component system nitrogen regulation sensor histidine kinase GlnL
MLLEMEADDRIEFLRDYDPSIPDFSMDPEQIHQVVLNIARNAMQAISDKGEISFSTRIASQQLIHGQRFKLVAILKITDNGIGISDDLKDTLFYPMVTSKSDGSGLGLSIAQTLIQQHHGKIECESWPGHTEFTVYLPITTL